MPYYFIPLADGSLEPMYSVAFESPLPIFYNDQRVGTAMPDHVRGLDLQMTEEQLQEKLQNGEVKARLEFNNHNDLEHPSAVRLVNKR